MSGEARYLVVSLGSIGRRHLRNLRRLCPAAKIGVLHLHTTATAELPEGANFQFGSIEQALAFAPDAAIVAGPAPTHVSVACALAAVGVHLLVEKPIADCDDGVPELLEICRQRRLTLMVGYNLRFLPSLRQVKDCLDQGAIGRVLAVRAEVGQYLPDWRPGTDYRQGVSARADLGGGALLELSHELDYLCWMFGLPMQVTAHGGCYGDLGLEVEDLVEIVMEYESPRRLVSVHLDMLQRVPARLCRFIGSEGSLVWNAITDHVELYRAATRQWEVLDILQLADRNDMYLDELAHFLECVRTGARPLVDGESGRRVLAIVTASRLSMAEARSVKVVYGNG